MDVKLIQINSKLNALLFDVLGHGCMLQLDVSFDSPVHALPTPTGAGLLHFLDLVWVPIPHDLVHVE